MPFSLDIPDADDELRFKQRFFPYAGSATAGRFLKHTEDYVYGFTREAELREKNIVLDLKSYDPLRRENSAVRYCFGLFGYVLGLDLPDEIFEHPAFVEMHLAAVDMVTWSNVRIICVLRLQMLTIMQDVYSYDMEQSMGHLTNNILTVLQREMGLDLQGAADYVGVHFKELVDKFQANKALLPSFGEELDHIVAYVITIAIARRCLTFPQGAHYGYGVLGGRQLGVELWDASLLREGTSQGQRDFDCSALPSPWRLSGEEGPRLHITYFPLSGWP